jgi:hypothetical protein
VVMLAYQLCLGFRARWIGNIVFLSMKVEGLCLEKWLLDDFLEGRSYRERLTEGTKSLPCHRLQSIMVWKLSDNPSGLFHCSADMSLSGYWSGCKDNVLFEAERAPTTLLCSVINCH